MEIYFQSNPPSPVCHTTCGTYGIYVMSLMWMFVAEEHRLFTVNNFRATMCCKVCKWEVGYVCRYEYVWLFVHVCWSLAVSGMPAEGRAADGSRDQSIPVI